jgi:hypothetical protein
MNVNRNWKLAAAGVAALAVVGAGSAFAATKLLTPNERSQAIIKDAAGQLGVQPDALTGALKKAIENQIDAEVKAGRLTKEQGDALKKRVESGDYPLLGLGAGGPRAFGFGFGHGFGGRHMLFGPGLDDAATYLGLTESQLRTELRNGKTLAQLAKDKGKTVDGLVDAMTADLKAKLDEGVKDGKITRARADQLLSATKDRVKDMATGERHSLPRPFFRHSDRDFRLPAAPPPDTGNAPA